MHSLRMRKLAPLLAVLALLSFDAIALDDPAFPDGGSLIKATDGGTGVTLDTFRPNAWNMALRCEGVQARYAMCEFNLARIATTQDGGWLDLDGGWVYDGGQNASQGTCTATGVNQLLDNDKTFDIAVPNNRRYISVLFTSATSSDGGLPACNTQIVTP